MAILKQGNLLQMQVHEGHHVVDEAFPQIVVEKQAPARKGKKPLAHYSSVVRVLGSDVKTAEEPVAQVCRGWACPPNSNLYCRCLLHTVCIVIQDLGREPGEVVLQTQEPEFDPQNPYLKKKKTTKAGKMAYWVKRLCKH